MIKCNFRFLLIFFLTSKFLCKLYINIYLGTYMQIKTTLINNFRVIYTKLSNIHLNINKYIYINKLILIRTNTIYYVITRLQIMKIFS